jgi:hypothetical protein
MTTIFVRMLKARKILISMNMKRKALIFFSLVSLTLLIFQSQVFAQDQAVCDTHVHLRYGKESPYKDGRTALPEDLISIYSHPEYKHVGTIVVAPIHNIEETRSLNDSGITFCQRHSKFYPICSVHPDDEQLALDEIERVAKLGVHFLKLHSITQDFDVASPPVDAFVK